MYGYASYNIGTPKTEEPKPKNSQNALARTASAPFALDEEENLGEVTPQTPITPKGSLNLF